MIEQSINKLRKQIADNGWLYQDDLDGNRIFAKEIYLGITANEWDECTNDEKLAWEEERKPEEQVEDVEIIEENLIN